MVDVKLGQSRGCLLDKLHHLMSPMVFLGLRGYMRAGLGILHPLISPAPCIPPLRRGHVLAVDVGWLEEIVCLLVASTTWSHHDSFYLPCLSLGFDVL